MSQPPSIIGEDPAFLDVVEKASRLARVDRPCLVLGERGTGKELVAARVHYLSPRWEGPLIKVNCAALTDSLLDSELFGHEAGAFTGARNRHVGRFERADGGTLILDEIHSASQAVQEKILRVIEYGELERVGGSRVVEVDTRVIGAANVDLPAQARAGHFRADLLDRLAFDVLTIPPLRARPGDLLPLADRFARDMARELGRETVPHLSERAIARLRAHDWPGNVRELRNVIERAVALAPAESEVIDDPVIDPFASPWRLAPPPDRPLDPTAATTPEDAPPLPFHDSVARYEARLITLALRRTGGNQRRAAEDLGLGYHQFRRLLAKHAPSPSEDQP